MGELPTGTITMLFSDIEGSTVLLRGLGDRYGEALLAQRALLRAAFSSWGGQEMGTEGDSFFVVFESAGDAVRCCVAAQRALSAQLSTRERELVTLVAQGRTNAQVAAQLSISVRAVRSRLDRIRGKTGSQRRADLTRLALQANLVLPGRRAPGWLRAFRQPRAFAAQGLPRGCGPGPGQPGYQGEPRGPAYVAETGSPGRLSHP
jgi:DNA-binding CsgD family transcriptional regulator